MPDTFVIRPNEDRPGWPLKKDFKAPKGSSIKATEDAQEAYEKALVAEHKKVPYYGHPYDDNLDWREMVQALKAQLTEITPDKWTFPWVAQTQVSITGATTIQPRVELGAFRRDWSNGPLVRYAYIRFDVIPPVTEETKPA